MNNRTIFTALVAASLLTVTPLAPAQSKTRAENGLAGVKLYDSGLKLISLYGSPDDIQAIGVGGQTVGPSGGGGMGPMGPMGGPPGMGGKGMPGAPGGMPGAPGGMGGPPGGMRTPGGGGIPPQMSAPDFRISEWLGDVVNNRQMGQPGMPGVNGGGPPIGSGGGPMGPMGGPMGGPPGMGGRGVGPMGPGGSMPGAPGGAGMGGATATNRVNFTRWVYKRNGTKFGYVLDKQNRVVEIEAIGLSNPKVVTSRGIRFGSTFGDIIKKYGSPDAYEIGGNTIVMRYLVRSKVAFRLNRLGVDKPHRVTGIVVAAGKS